MNRSGVLLELAPRNLPGQSSVSKSQPGAWQISTKPCCVEKRFSNSPMAKHLVLIFAYHFPPENTIGGARPFRFSKYLSRSGYTCRVFTAADQTGSNNPNTEYVPDPFVTHARRAIGWQLERVVWKVFLPGEVCT